MYNWSYVGQLSPPIASLFLNLSTFDCYKEISCVLFCAFSENNGSNNVIRCLVEATPLTIFNSL